MQSFLLDRRPRLGARSGALSRLHVFARTALSWVARADVANGPAIRGRRPLSLRLTTRASRPLGVFVVGGGRTLFEAAGDRRIRLLRSGSDAVDPDLVVFPCGTDRRFEKVLATPLPERVRLRMAAGAVGVIFDASTEGSLHKPDRTEGLHAAIGRLGVPRDRCAYITQDRGYDAEYRAYCAARHVDRPTTVLQYDYWISKALARFEHGGEEVFAERLSAFRSRDARRSRRFIALNRSARPARTVLLLSLLRDGLWDAGFISFGGFGRPFGRKDRKTGQKPLPTPEGLSCALPGFEDLVADLAPLLPALAALGRVTLPSEDRVSACSPLDEWVVPAYLPEYGQSWFSVVTETEMRLRPSRITEKPLKPLVNFHPLVVFGNPGSLAMIRRFGFATFAELFDETYDDELDPRRRFDLVYGEVVRICRLDEEALGRLERAIAEKLIFNARLGLTTLPRAYREQQDRALIDRLVSAIVRRPG